MQIDAEDLLHRFLKYVQIETRSDAASPTTPSTACQWDLLRLLASELKELGVQAVEVTEAGYVLGTVPATSRKAGVPRIAWFAHVDTATNLPGAAKPLVHRRYDGRPIVFPDNPALELSPASSPRLGDAIGEDVITASGTTLLGADDKAGVAIVMAAARHLLLHPEIPHGELRICFNPDEEIARGVHQLDLKQVGAVAAYTLDGETRGELYYETFSADAAVLEIKGVAAHPGYAKDIMVNALRIAGRFLAALPRDLSPESTRGREGYVHPTECTGSSEHATVRLILRDFELEGLAAKRELLASLVRTLQAEEPRAALTLSFTEQYRNMRYWLQDDMQPVEHAREAIRRAGLEPKAEAIRGGTDGSNLTARGLPTPNLFTGMHEVHSEREWVSLQDMVKATEMLVHLAQVWEEAGG